MKANRTITMLGTGNALATRCYNTCFLLQDGDTQLLVDAGGGNGILTQLEKAGISLKDIHHLFITHAHTDHLMGCIWVVRLVAQLIGRGWYEGVLHVYSHGRALSILRQCCQLMLPEKDFAHIGQDIIFHTLDDGQQFKVGSIHLQAFDIHSTKEPQFGFRATLSDGTSVACLGDEPYSDACRQYAEDADWLMSEAFCLYQDREHFQPYEKHHATVIDTAHAAQQLRAKNLIIYHTEDHHLDTRRKYYTAEAAQVYQGHTFVPDDLEVIPLNTTEQTTRVASRDLKTTLSNCMTEKEKAARGMMYNPNKDPELIAEMHKANDIVFEYNHLPPSQRERRTEILRSFLGRCGEHITMLPPIHLDYGYNTFIGENFFSNVNLVVLDGARVTIGDNVFIAPNVGIYTAGHVENAERRADGIEYAKPVTIGNNVWIGGGVQICPGVTIGDGCIIGAGSVVTHDIPPHTVAVGNPCRVIREVNDEN